MIEENKLSHYVSNLDRDIYTISNLPEEIIATVFARVSRSPNSFRENLLKVSEEKASQFHEKWVLNYGHASVSELATVHIGIENVSRLFSAVLERSNLYISPIEYSQRYQKPKRGNFYLPVELNDPKYDLLKKEYIAFQNNIYDDYIHTFQLLLDSYQKNETKRGDESDKAFEKRIEKRSFEDARYLLTLAVFTNLGITANARAMEDSLVHLLSSEYSEVRQRGEEIKNEVTHTLPTLIKYAKENKFLIETRIALQNHIKRTVIHDNKKVTCQVILLDYTGKDSHHPEEEALDIILSEMLYQNGKESIISLQNSLKKDNLNSKLKLISYLLSGLGDHDQLPPAFEKIVYKCQFIISESCWHQFLRHRKIQFTWQYPSVDNGYIIPATLKDSQAQEIFEKGMAKSETMFKKLEDISPQVAHYSVTNAHYRCVVGEFSLWELYHLISLRMTPQAQREIHEMMKELVSQIKMIHPHLLQPALDRMIRKSE